jgi:hypothetical protein
MEHLEQTSVSFMTTTTTTTIMYSRRYQYQISVCHKFPFGNFPSRLVGSGSERLEVMVMMPMIATSHSALRNRR